MDNTPSELNVNSFQSQSIRSHGFLDVLKSFNQLLFTSIGPNGKIKVVTSAGGITVMTTSSKRLIEWIELDNPLLHVISNAIKNQWEAYADFGLYTGLTSTMLLLKVLNDRLPHSILSSLIKCHSSTTVSLIDELRKDLKVDISSLECLIKVVETVISSKPLCCDPAVMNVSELAACVVGVFIRGISENLGSFGKVSVVVDEGHLNEPPTNFTGLIYDSPESSSISESKWNVVSDENRKIMVVLFAVNLTATNQNGNNSGKNFILDEEYSRAHENALLEKMEKTCEKFLDAGVRVFACQKIIHPHLKCFLRRRGVLALERMGKELADSFAVLTGAVPLGSPTFDEVPAGCIGELESVKSVERGGRTYLFLGRDDDKSRGIATILANAAGEQQAAELKVVIHQSLQTLRHLVSKPYVLPGSGCLETWLAVQLQKKILSNLDELCKEHNCSSVEVLAVLKWFRNTFLAVSKRISVTSGSCLIVDSLYNHCWQSLEAANCACGLLTNDICDAHGAELVDFEIEVNEEKLFNASSSKNLAFSNATCTDHGGIVFPKINFSTIAHVDVCSSKMNAISLALEVCQSILSIGLVVY